MAQHPIDDVAGTMRDAAYVTVGLGMIVFQRLQVRRKEFEHTLSSQAEEARGALGVVSELVAERLKAVEERVGATLERR